MSATRICTKSDCHLAGVPQPLDNFYRDKKGKYGRQSQCKRCKSVYMKAHRKTLVREGVDVSRLSDVQLELAIDLYESIEYMTVKLLASIFRMNRKTMSSELKRSGTHLKRRKKKKRYVNRRDLHECFEREMTSIEAAKIMNVPATTISGLWREAGLFRGIGWKRKKPPTLYTEKICSRSDCDLAGTPQSLDNFYPNKLTRDGRTSQCNGCALKRSRIYQETSEGKETTRIGKARWQRSEKGKVSHKKSVKKYQSTEKGKKALKKSARKWAQKNPEKVKAGIITRTEIQQKRLKPARELKCVECGEQAAHYHHHNGYEEEHLLDVIPVCRVCHWRLDSLQNTQ